MSSRESLGKSALRRATTRLHVEHLEMRTMLTATLSAAFQVVSEIPASPIDAANYLQPTEYVPFTINHGELAAQLSTAPMEFTSAAEHPVRLNIPAPDGTVDAFDVVESPIMAPELAARFPQITTYRGMGVTDPAASIRLDLTPQGFHAQVLSPNGGFYVDPFYHLDNSAYVSYFIANAAVDAETASLRDGLDEWLVGYDGELIDLESQAAVVDSHDRPEYDGLNDRDGSPVGLRFTGETLRTYRLANAATAEYTGFHGGTVAAGQAAIVTAINRVTGIYENEFAIRLELVPNNDLLVYTSNPDPYSNNNAFAMLSQNQANIDNVIGTPNYDIGHVFSRGGGGVAGLGVVGNNSRKAEGVSGLGAPIGDFFTVDYVAHEMGHQFDALHTFNGCGPGGTGGSSAYEPGSGSTIMAYAGICGADNLQAHSDPYFHWKSLQEVTSFVNNQIPSVGTTTATGNTGPVADAGSDYAIPTETPFRLTGAGSDINSADVLTYTWEQADRGPALQLADPDNGLSPIFRSWTGTTDPVRIVPRLSNLLNNTTPRGERYATLPRLLDWQLTVRDNAPGAGGYDIDAMRINVINTGSPFSVTSPNTSSVIWTGNTSETIEWNVAGTSGGTINTPNVNILLSTDGGFTYPTTLAANVPNDGSHQIVVPNVDTNSARIMVEGAGNIFFDLSNSNFSIELGSLLGDFDGDGQLGCPDVDELSNAIANGSTNPIYDLTGDSLVNTDDLAEWVLNLKGTLMADANLDFVVDGTDFIIWNENRFQSGTAWCTGDFNADGFTDGTDFVVWNDNRFQNAVPPTAFIVHDTTSRVTLVRPQTSPVTIVEPQQVVPDTPLPNVETSHSSRALARRIAAQSEVRHDSDRLADEFFAQCRAVVPTARNHQ